MTPRSPLVCALLACVVLALSPSPALGGETSRELTNRLGEAWRMLEAGNLDRAGGIYSDLLADAEGRDHAEVYYGLSLVAWERRDALEAWRWLAAARRGAAQTSRWNPGRGGSWQRRIEDRLRYIEANFSLRGMRRPEKGAPLPPLADPPPRDPILASFADAVPARLEAVHAAQPEGLIHLMLPNGSWWVGDKLEWHDGGAMEATETADHWTLAPASGADRDKYEERVAELKAGGSLGRALISKLMIARQAPKPMVDAELRRRRAEALAAEYARRRPQLEALRARQQALVAEGRVEEAAAIAKGFAGSGGGKTLLTWDEITADALGDVARQLGEVWTEPGWHMRYALVFPSKSTRWTLELPELGVLLRIDRGGELLIQGVTTEGKRKLKEELGTWHLGGRPNRVDLWFDGTQLKVSANGQTFGPVAVSRFAPEGTTRWKLALNDESALMFDVRVEAFAGF